MQLSHPEKTNKEAHLDVIHPAAPLRLLLRDSLHTKAVKRASQSDPEPE